MSTLWQANGTDESHGAIMKYTVGDDYLLDQQLLGYDIAASRAHVSMLGTAGIIPIADAEKLQSALDSLQTLWKNGQFVILPEQEDGHTAIESYLTEELGSIGKKLHTGRSRNDQALVMMRLYLKDVVQRTRELSKLSVSDIKKTVKKHGSIVMPGYTHTQKAMPGTIGAWLMAYAYAIKDVNQLLLAVGTLIDQNPLGSAAGFGTALPIDREFTTKELGFKKTQVNAQYCALSRGLFELMAVNALNQLMVILGKFAHDMMLFTSQEFGFFSLPDSFTTGSSIMPHKHNYDLFEIMRAKSHSFGSYSQQLQSIVGGVGSGYHRDLQLTKSLTLNAFTVVQETLEVFRLAITTLQPNEKMLSQAITPEMLSVSKIDMLVAEGVPFREAYRQVKLSLSK